MIFVSYYTDDTPYKAEAVNLAASLDRFECRHDILRVPAQRQRTWAEGALLKGRVCAWMLEVHAADAPVVFLDADAEVRRDPSALEAIHGVDFALTWNSRYRWWRANMLCMWPTVTARRVVTQWTDACNKALSSGEWTKRPEQDLLNVALPVADVRLQVLDADVWALTEFRDGPRKNPIIWHRQAARKHRAVIDGQAKGAHG